MAQERNAAFVDLTSGEVEVKKIPREVREKYLGGRGIDAYLLYNLLKPGTDPLGPDNVLLVSAGLLTGTPSPAPSRTHICAKSPLTNMFGSANMGGFFSAELRYAGFDHLIITGKADKPVYLWVNDGTIEIRDASHLWGKDTVETMVLVREEMDDEDVKVLTIGVGGEKLVRYANVMTGIKNSGGRTGMGAVMGSKNLKAIAARGSLPIPLADPEGTLAYHKEMIDYIQGSKFAEIMGTWGTLYIYDVTNSTGLVRTRNFQSNQSQYSEDLEAEAIEPYSVGTAACYGCTMHCRHKYKIKDGPYKGVYDEGPEYTTQGAFGTEVGCTSMHTLLVGNHLVNRLGIDTLEVGSMIGWAMELYEKGLLPEELVGDLDLTWGNDDAVIQLTKDIAYRRGLGDILAEGPLRAAEKLGPETLQYNIQIKGMSNLQSDERATPSLALNIATSTRGSDHLRSRPAIDLYHLPEPVLAKIYGKEGLSSDYRDYEGKPWQVYWQACLYAVVDALGICKFQTVFMSPNSPTWVEYSKMIELATGMKITPEQVMEIGNRIYTTERMFNMREGATRADDWLPDRYFDEPVPAGLDAVRGLCIDREKFTKMIDEYYEHHGWDNEGVPTPETLTRLNLDRQPEHVL